MMGLPLMDAASDGHMEAMRSTALIVSSFVKNRSFTKEDLTDLIDEVYRKLRGLDGKDRVLKGGEFEGVSHEYIVSQIDGRQYKLLTNHLKRHGLTPAEYRRRYDLPNDYPMVAPSHSAKRRAVALRNFSGRKRRQTGTASNAEA